MLRDSINAAYFILIAVIVLGLVAIFTIIQPMISSTQAQKEVLATASEKLTQRQAFLQAMDRKRAVLQSREADERTLAVALPATDSVEDVARIIHTAAQTAGGAITTITNNTVQAQRDAAIEAAAGEAGAVPAGVVQLEVSVDFTGTYQQLRVLLEQLEKSPRLLDVTTLSINRNDQAPDTVSAKLHVRFYSERANPPAT